MLLDLAPDVFESIQSFLPLKDQARLLQLSADAFKAAAHLLYTSPRLRSQTAFDSFSRALSGPRAEHLQGLVTTLDIVIASERGVDGFIRLPEKPHALSIELAKILPRLSRLRRLLFYATDHAFGRKLFDSLACCPELTHLVIDWTPLQHAVGGSLREYVVPSTLTTLILQEGAYANTLVTALIRANAATLEALFLAALRRPHTFPESEAKLLAGLQDISMPKLASLLVGPNEDGVISVSVEGLTSIIKGAPALTQLRLLNNKFDSSEGIGALCNEIAKLESLKALVLFVDLPFFSPEAKQAAITMVRTMRSKPQALEFGDSAMYRAESPSIDLRKLFGSFMSNPQLARHIQHLSFGLVGLNAGYLKAVKRLCPSLTQLSLLVDPTVLTWRDAFSQVATAFEDPEESIEFLTFEIVWGLDIGAVQAITGLNKSESWGWLTHWKQVEEDAGSRETICGLFAALPDLQSVAITGLPSLQVAMQTVLTKPHGTATVCITPDYDADGPLEYKMSLTSGPAHPVAPFKRPVQGGTPPIDPGFMSIPVDIIFPGQPAPTAAGAGPDVPSSSAPGSLPTSLPGFPPGAIPITLPPAFANMLSSLFAPMPAAGAAPGAAGDPQPPPMPGMTPVMLPASALPPGVTAAAYYVPQSQAGPASSVAAPASTAPPAADAPSAAAQAE